MLGNVQVSVLPTRNTLYGTVLQYSFSYMLSYIHNKNIISKNKVNYSILWQNDVAFYEYIYFFWIWNWAKSNRTHLLLLPPKDNVMSVVGAWSFKTLSPYLIHICFFKGAYKSHPVSSPARPEIILFLHLFLL